MCEKNCELYDPLIIPTYLHIDIVSLEECMPPPRPRRSFANLESKQGVLGNQEPKKTGASKRLSKWRDLVTKVGDKLW